MRVVATEQGEGVGHHVEHGGEPLGRSGRRAGHVHHQAGTDRARHPTRQASLPVGQPDRFGETRGEAVDDRTGRLGREVSGREACAPRGDDQPVEVGGQPAQRSGDRFDAVGDDDEVALLPPVSGG